MEISNSLEKQKVTTWKNLLTWVGGIANIGHIGAASGLSFRLCPARCVLVSVGGCRQVCVVRVERSGPFDCGCRSEFAEWEMGSGQVEFRANVVSLPSSVFVRVGLRQLPLSFPQSCCRVCSWAAPNVSSIAGGRPVSRSLHGTACECFEMYRPSYEGRFAFVAHRRWVG